MIKIFTPSRRLLALFLFLPITPSIAAITVFVQSVLTGTNHDVSIVPQHSIRVIDSSTNYIYGFEEND